MLVDLVNSKLNKAIKGRAEMEFCLFYLILDESGSNAVSTFGLLLFWSQDPGKKSHGLYLGAYKL